LFEVFTRQCPSILCTCGGQPSQSTERAQIDGVCSAQALRGKRLATPVKKRSSKRAPEQLPAKKPRYHRQLVCVISRRQHQNDVQRPRIEHGSAGPVKEGPPSYSPEGRSVKLRSQEKRGKSETSRHNACKTMPIAVLERVLGLGTR